VKSSSEITVEEFEKWTMNLGGANDWYVLMDEGQLALARLADEVYDNGSGHIITRQEPGKVVVLVRNGIIWQI